VIDQARALPARETWTAVAPPASFRRSSRRDRLSVLGRPDLQFKSVIFPDPRKPVRTMEGILRDMDMTILHVMCDMSLVACASRPPEGG